MKPVPHGEPYAGKLHVRFDEGAGVPDNKGRPALLYLGTGLLGTDPNGGVKVVGVRQAKLGMDY